MVERITWAVMAKAPEPGRVKTRMTRGSNALSSEQAAELQRACVRDIVRRSFPERDRRVLWRRGDPSAEVWDEATDLGWELASQSDRDLGENLRTVCDEALAATGGVIVLGTDSPDLPSALLDEARAALETNDVVLGPAFDGGYFLIGLTRRAPELFSNIAWGTERVLAQTLERAAACGLQTHLLPFWYDLDEVADLRRLGVHSGRVVGSLTPHWPSATLAFLQALGTDAHGDEV